VLQFGRSEALSERGGLAAFVRDYQKLLDQCARQTPRLVLVTPPPFFHGVVAPHGRFRFPHEFGFAFGTEIARQESGKPILVMVGMASGENGGSNEGASSKYHCGRAHRDSV